jgi:hypothetical protein
MWSPLLLHWRSISIAAAFVASFGLSLAIMAPPRVAEPPERLPLRPSSPSAAHVPATTNGLGGAATGAAGVPPAPAPAAVVPAAPSAAMPRSEQVALVIRRWGGGVRYVGEVRNESEQSTDVTLTVLSSSSAHGARLDFQLGPGEKRGLVSSPSFDFRSGDQILMHTSAFGDRVEQVQ